LPKSYLNPRPIKLGSKEGKMSPWIFIIIICIIGVVGICNNWIRVPKKPSIGKEEK